MAAHRAFAQARCWGADGHGRLGMPITDAELDVLEAWFDDIFDELFGPCR